MNTQVKIIFTFILLIIIPFSLWGQEKETGENINSSITTESATEEVQNVGTLDCIPPFLQEDKKYYFRFSNDKELKVKIKKITANTCWIKVKEVLPKEFSDAMFSAEKKSAFWINMQNVSVIRNKN